MMTPEPPPLADPHSTESIPANTVRRPIGTVVKSLIYGLLGVTLVVGALPFAASFVVGELRYGFQRGHMAGFILNGTFALLTGFVGLSFLRHVAHIWNHGQ